MANVTYTDAWSATEQRKPLTADHKPIGSGPEPGDPTSAHAGSFVDQLTSWVTAALGPQVVGVVREVHAVTRKLAAPGHFQHPWAWIGASAAIGYALGRSGVLRPIAAFTVRIALTSFLERAMRADD